MIVIDDELHCEQVARFRTFREAVADLELRAVHRHDSELNRAPCSSWRTCERHYHLREYDTASTPWTLLRDVPALTVAPAGSVWADNFRREWWNSFGRTDRTLEASRALRDRGVREHPDLVRRVSAVMFRRDPVRINFETNTDEYAFEAGSVVARLSECGSPADVRRVVVEEFCHWFGPEYAAITDRLHPLADEVAGLWFSSADEVKTVKE